MATKIKTDMYTKDISMAANLTFYTFVCLSNKANHILYRISFKFKIDKTKKEGKKWNEIKKKYSRVIIYV
jgi:hypothetical protein